MDIHRRTFSVDDLEYYPKNIPENAVKKRMLGLENGDELGAIVGGKPFQPTNIPKIDGVVYEVMKAMRLPLKCPLHFQPIGRKPTKAALLYGEPGTGKSTIARRLEDECDRINERRISYFEYSPAVLMGGVPANNVTKAFDAGRIFRPSLIFFDEVDSLLQDEIVFETFLLHLDGMSAVDGIFVLGATNYIERVGPAMCRPGRFQLVFKLELPGKTERRHWLNAITVGMTVDGQHFQNIVDNTDGFSPAELMAVCNKASLLALGTANTTLANHDVTTWTFASHNPTISAKDLENALNYVKDCRLRWERAAD